MGVSARTLYVVLVSLTRSTRTRASDPVSPLVAPLRRSSPIAKVVPITGMPTPGVVSVPATAEVRPGCPSLNTITADAPACSALSALSRNGQVPRCTRAIVSAGKPAKSASSQPLVLPFMAPGAGTTRSTAVTSAVTSPFPE